MCHNNLYAEHTSFAKTSPVAHVAARAVGYNVSALTVDGDDFIATWEALTTAIDRAAEWRWADADRGDDVPAPWAHPVRLHGLHP
jgi:TPP-dependent pyruvate/acetoin dehydrogenase alpha subunit